MLVGKSLSTVPKVAGRVPLFCQEIMPRKLEERHEPLLILHGLLGNSMNWRSIARRRGFSHDRRVIIPDLRNHGHSGHAPSMSFHDMMEDIRVHLHEQGIQEVSVMGHSMGGKVAMLLALEYPKLVSKLICVDIAPVNYPRQMYEGKESIVEVMHAMRKMNDELGGRTHLGRKGATSFLSGCLKSPKLVGFVLTNLIAPPPPHTEPWRWRCNFDVIEKYFPEIASFPASPMTPPFPGPALFIGGTLSNHILPEHVPLIERLFPQATVRWIEDAGHWTHSDKPNVFIQQVSPFLVQ
jgi:pimeloyl-ACP methyl ester carboxylesterase